MPQRPPEDGQRKVKDGEWVGSIANQYGYTNWEHDLWDRPENAALKSLRKDPHVLAVGDILFIPPWQDKTESCATDQKHSFKIKAPNEVFRLRLIDDQNALLKNEEYLLALRWDPSGGDFKQQNKNTDGNGVLCESIPSTTTSGTIYLPRVKKTIRLRFGYLTPLDLDNPQLLIRGAQQRLHALGFYRGSITSDPSAAYRGAVKAFQQFCKDNPDLPNIVDPGLVDGKMGPKTRTALMTYYGS